MLSAHRYHFVCCSLTVCEKQTSFTLHINQLTVLYILISEENTRHVVFIGQSGETWRLPLKTLDFPLTFLQRTVILRCKRQDTLTVPSITHTQPYKHLSYDCLIMVKKGSGAKSITISSFILRGFVVPTVAQLITNRSWKKKQKLRSARHFKGVPVWMIKGLLQPTELPLSQVCLWWMLNMQKPLGYFDTLWKKTCSFYSYKELSRKGNETKVLVDYTLTKTQSWILQSFFFFFFLPIDWP